MTYVTIAAGIKTLLDTVDGLAVVYDHEAKELANYPAATITAAGHENSFADLQANKRMYSFYIRVYYRTADADTAESAVRTIVDDIIAAIEADVTLSGTCDYAMPTRSTWAYVEREVPLRYAQITVQAKTRVAR